MLYDEKKRHVTNVIMASKVLCFLVLFNSLNSNDS